MKKPSSLPIPETYAFDDTPKAFKRMMQRKNGDQESFKKFKQNQKDFVPVNKRTSFSEPSNSHETIPTKKQGKPSPSPSSDAAANFNAAASGFKTVRAKRKAHLQARDLKKKLKKFDSSRDAPSHTSTLKKHVRDVVQEPPKLHQPKKSFKKIKDDREELKDWSDLEDEEQGDYNESDLE